MSTLLLETPPLRRWKKIKVEFLAREEYKDRRRRPISRPNIGGRPAASWVVGRVVHKSGAADGTESLIAENRRAASAVLTNPDVLHVKVWETATLSQNSAVQEKEGNEKMKELGTSLQYPMWKHLLFSLEPRGSLHASSKSGQLAPDLGEVRWTLCAHHRHVPCNCLAG